MCSFNYIFIIICSRITSYNVCYTKLLRLIANFKRAQESSRVLEEFTKLTSIKDSENFKYIRYELYNLETVLITVTSNSK